MFPERRMKIAVVGTRGIPGVTGGVERHCEELYPRIVERGAEVVLYARDKYVSSDSSWHGVEVVSLPASRSSSTEAITHTCRAIMAARNLRPDIVHIHSIGPASLTGLARAFGMRVVLTAHAADYLQSKWGALASAYLRMGESLGVNGASEVISVSRHYGDQLAQRYGRVVSVIPNGPSGIVHVETGATVASMGLTAGGYALFVGRLAPDKRVEDAIAACAGDSIVPLVIIGGPTRGTAYSDRLRHAAEAGSVFFAGDRFGSELAELFSAAGVFVLPSAAEGLSLSLLEAMAYGVPSVASDIAGNRELLDDGSLGALVAVADVEGLRAAIARALSMDSAHRREVAKRLRLTVARTYDWEAIADRTMDVYRRAISG